LLPFVGDSFWIANFLSELKSFVTLDGCKALSSISTRFSIFDTLVLSDTTESARLP
jgi:hypothetical protein